MMRPATSLWRLATAAAVLTACSEPLEKRVVPLPPATDDVEVRLTSAVAAPRAGDTVVVALRVRGRPGATPLGSYLARLAYDSTRIGWLGQESETMSGALHMVNGGITGEVRAAGAAASGFSEGALLSLRFVARTDDPFAGLELRMEDLRATDGSAVTGVRVVPGVTLAEGTT